MIKAIAIDDEFPALQILEVFCKRVDFINLEKTFNKPTDAIRYINKFPVDLIFLDINMPSVSGIELVKNIKQETRVIFTTAYSDYAVEGFNLEAIDFLLKPFTFERFQQAVNKAQQFLNFQNNPNGQVPGFIYIRADYKLIRIDLNDIILIEGLDDYLKIHLLNQKPIVARMTIKNMIEKLPASNFVRVHRSYVVAFDKIRSTRGKIISIGEEEIPVGSSYEENFSSMLNRQAQSQNN